ncbi:DUF3558 family protein [Actinokineospora sp. NPDC004072]
MVVLAGCSTSGEQAAPPTTTAEPTTTTTTAETTTAAPETTADITGYVGKGCELVGKDVLAGVGITTAGQNRGVAVCMWIDPGAKRKVMLRLIGDHDPLVEVRGAPDRVSSTIGGFPAAQLTNGQEKACDVYVRTAPNQGYMVMYGTMDGSGGDLCPSAVKVAEDVAGRV